MYLTLREKEERLLHHRHYQLYQWHLLIDLILFSWKQPISSEQKCWDPLLQKRKIYKVTASAEIAKTQEEILQKEIPQ